MPSVEDIPADMRPRIGKAAPAPLAGPSGRKFIGSGTAEYPGADERKAAQAVDTGDEPKASSPEKASVPCPRCKDSVLAESSFCQACGLDLKRKRAAETLGIEITDDNVQDYLFKGFVAKEVELFPGHTATFKSVQGKEIDECDQQTEKHFEGRRPTDMEWLNYRSKVLMAYGWIKIDGRPTGESPAKRLEYIQTQGAQLIELIGRKYKLFNDSISEMLNSDTLGKS